MLREVDEKNDFSDEAIVQKLTELGLSEKESRVYIALLPLRDIGTSHLIRATGLHGQFIYAALERLESLGLAKHVIQNGRKKFSPGAPERLLALLDEKRTAAELVIKQLNARSGSKQVQEFDVYQGRSAFVAHEFALLDKMPEGGVIDVIGSVEDTYINLFGHEIDAYERIRAKKRVSIRYLGTAAQHNYLKVMVQQRKFFAYRILPSASPAIDTDIALDKIVFHLYGDPVVTFVFTNKAISDGYKKFFEALWSISTV